MRASTADTVLTRAFSERSMIATKSARSGSPKAMATMADVSTTIISAVRSRPIPAGHGHRRDREHGPTGPEAPPFARVRPWPGFGLQGHRWHVRRRLFWLGRWRGPAVRPLRLQWDLRFARP